MPYRRPSANGFVFSTVQYVTANLRPSPQEYGLTVGRIQRYKIAASPCSCACLLTRLEPVAVLPAVREWRNWQTRET